MKISIIAILNLLILLCIYTYTHFSSLNYIYMHIYTHMYKYIQMHSFIFSLMLTLSSIIHSFWYLPITIWYYILSAQRISFSFSCRECLLAKDSLTFCLSGNVFITLPFWKESFTGYRIIAWLVLFSLPLGFYYL